jgi:hypothetical protein
MAGPSNCISGAPYGSALVCLISTDIFMLGAEGITNAQNMQF